MSTKLLSDSLITTISKGPLVIMLLLGLGFWQASKMTPAQIDTVEHLAQVLNNPVGSAIYTILMLVLLYSLVLWPVGKFLSTMITEFLEIQKLHNIQTKEHFEASKLMFHEVEIVKNDTTKMLEIIEKFYKGVP